MSSPPDKAKLEAPRPREAEPFLARWSRVKREAQEPAQPAPAAPPPAQKSEVQPPELPPVEALTPESDYRGFLHPGVDEGVRRAALRKLFADPHFNVMDGLDVYIDDYSKAEALPAALLAQLRQAQKILDWARERPESAEQGEAGATADDRLIAPAEAPVAPAVTSAAAVAQPEAPGIPHPGAEPDAR